MNHLVAPTRTCAKCRKTFYLTCREDMWGYAYDGKLTCSYSCMRAMERDDKPKAIHRRAEGNAQMLYRQRLRGKSYANIALTATAHGMGLECADDVRRYLGHWISRHPDEAEKIRLAIEAELGSVKRSAVADLTGKTLDQVIAAAKRLEIPGIKVGKYIRYAPADADRLIRELRRETA